EQRPVRIEPVARPRFRGAACRSNDVEKRMANETRQLLPIGIVEPFFERKDDAEAIDAPCDLAYSSAAPGPYLRTDVVEDGDAELLGLLGEEQVELGIVDEDDQVGTLFLQKALEATVGREQATEGSKGLDQAHRRDAGGIDEDAHAGLPQTLAADAG